MNDDVRQRLRDAAGAYRPDRERMLARIERGRSGPRTAPAGRGRSVPGWVRIAGAAAGVAGALAVGGFVVGAAFQQDEGPRQTVAVPPSARATPGPAPSAAPSADTTRRTPAAPPVADGPLWSAGAVDPGSNAYWAQSDVTVKAERQLSALTVEVRVAQTGGVSDTGNWRSLPAEDFTVSVTERDGFLVYRWVLKAGRTVPVGEYVFAGQYDHAQGRRDAGGDTYAVTGRTTEGERAAVGGDFG
ncbi:hypothetical protein [Streptomyces sp. NPDC049813]|uniref:hypothetical protein n=1 Tax=Streptomyces sp. NPDC049813 TaxID=3365597 RepID=UPI0037A2C6B8